MTHAKSNRIVFVLWVVAVLVVVGSAYVIERRAKDRSAHVNYLSCVRSNDVRRSLRISAASLRIRALERAGVETGFARTIDNQAATSAWQAIQSVPNLDCTHPLRAR